MRKYWIIIVAGVLLIVALAGVLYSKKSTTTVAPAKDPTVNATTKAAQIGPLEEVLTVDGKLEALNAANVVPKTAGKIAGVSVDVGSLVSAGQTMVALESDDLAAAVNVAEATVQAAQITYDLALKQFNRGQELLTAGALSQADYDNNYKGALDKAQVALISAQASLAQSQVKYNDSFVKSPLSGVVTARNANVGELAGTSSPVVVVMNLSKVTVTVNVNEAQINRLKVGQEVKVTVNAVSDLPFPGTIMNIALAANSSSKVFPIKILIDNPDQILKPGMFAEASFTWVGEPGLLVPTTAVTTVNGSQRVFLAKDGVARECPVIAGESDAQNTLIKSGLNNGDIVIVNGNDAMLKDGIKIVVAK